MLEATPNRWETATALYDAARALPGQRQERLLKAYKIFAEIGAEAELRRARREQDQDGLAGDTQRAP